MNDKIIIQGASENNLKNICVEIPHNTFTVVTGVSGSGKSSLVYDVIFKEGRRKYLETFSGYSKKYFGKLQKPNVQLICGLKPAISIDQKTTIRGARSTVGTLSGLYDYLRLLFARFSICENPSITVKPERSLFSFNSIHGACPVCKGLGNIEKIDVDKLILNHDLALSQGALVITAPNGYIIYSQVTMDVLNQVLNAHGFNVNIPWKDLTDDQKKIVLYGSDIISIPFGKHTLESRMKWTGITAKPREEGYYKGIIPVMDEILKRDRNENILRFVSAVKCDACNGTKLRSEALSFYFYGNNIADITSMTINNCIKFFSQLPPETTRNKAINEIKKTFVQRAEILQKLGVGYLTIDRESATLSSGEAQRIRLATQVGCGLRNIMYILDEPSVGLHARDNKKLMEVLTDLKSAGNTLIIVEHDEDVIRYADYLIDIGPKAGINGGNILFSDFTKNISVDSVKDISSKTFDFLFNRDLIEIPKKRRNGTGKIVLQNVCKNNLKNITVTFKLGAFNVITGVSGAGKSSIAEYLIQRYNEHKLESTISIDKIIDVDQSSIGRSPKSNPATYTGLSDHIRDLFAEQTESKKKKFEKGRFSFNNKGGRCETCQGAGVVSVGMHFLGDVDTVCDTCNGKRFNEDILKIKYKEKNIFEVLEMTVDEAVIFFSDHSKIMRYLNALTSTGLGYIKLGQPSPTLSGGEAQRVKLASELAKPQGKHTLYILDEPSTGLHTADLKILLSSLNRLVEMGHTLIVIEHNLHIIKSADHIIDIGPESAENGGEIVFEGSPEKLIECAESYTGKELKKLLDTKIFEFTHHKNSSAQIDSEIKFNGVVTNNLKNINIEIPENKITVFTGLSGSGKSSLLIDTIYAESRQRFAESFPAWVRAHISKPEKPDFESCSGLMPAVFVGNDSLSDNPRSTMGTSTEIYDYYRLLYARIGKSSTNENMGDILSSFFSFNHESGACKHCKGLGFIITCDIEKLVSHPEKSLLNGAINGTKTGKFYGDIHGQYIWTLRAIGLKNNIDFSLPWNQLDERAKQIAMLGSGDIEYNVIWKYKRKNIEGEHSFKTKWPGFIFHVNDEYLRKHADNRGEEMLNVMRNEYCPSCNGARLEKEPLQYLFAGLNISELCELSISKSIELFKKIEQFPKQYNISLKAMQISQDLRFRIIEKLEFLNDAGLGYLSLSRQAGSLSGGEARRTSIAGKIHSNLTGLLYVLDEPTIGLHPADTKQLIKLINQLKSDGNTIAIIEHDAEIIRNADHIIDIGPNAGNLGGSVVASGSFENITACENSLTGKYFKETEAYFQHNKKRLSSSFLSIKGAHANNLKQINIDFPVGVFTVVTGVSGSGKTSLVFDVLSQSLLYKKPVNCASIKGFELFDEVVVANQQDLHLTRSGNIATICDFYDEIRNLFAGTDKAKYNKFDKSFFSFNASGGRCETCLGEGKVKVSMDFFSDIWSECETCHGLRFKAEILNCFYRGKNISDVLQLTVAESMVYFSENKKITRAIQVLQECGLGYLQLGQSANTLSCGEAQRLKLAQEFISKKGHKNLYLFDEPTTGLHFKDIQNLLILFQKLLDAGNTIIAIEHNIQMIYHADNILEIGPNGGDEGGYVITSGSIDEIKKSDSSILKNYLFAR